MHILEVSILTLIVLVLAFLYLRNVVFSGYWFQDSIGSLSAIDRIQEIYSEIIEEYEEEIARIGTDSASSLIETVANKIQSRYPDVDRDLVINTLHCYINLESTTDIEDE